MVIIDLMQDKLDEVKSELDQYGEIITVQADVSKEADVENYVKTTVDQKLKDFNKVMAVNVQGVTAKVVNYCSFKLNTFPRNITFHSMID